MKQITYNEQRNPFMIALLTAFGIFIFNTTITAFFNFPGIFIFTSLSGFLVIPFFWIKMRNIGIEPYQYFNDRPFGVHKPERLLNFQLTAMKEQGVEFTTTGCILKGVPTNYLDDFPAEVHVQGLVYRYSQRPSGESYRWGRDKNLFWSTDDAYYYAGKVGQVKPQEPLELRSLRTGLFRKDRWYYIQYNGGLDGGFTLRHLMEASECIRDHNNNDIDEPEAIELMELIRHCHGIVEKFGENRYAIYFENKQDAAKVLEWLNSRYMMKMMLENSY